LPHWHKRENHKGQSESWHSINDSLYHSHKIVIWGENKFWRASKFHLYQKHCIADKNLYKSVHTDCFRHEITPQSQWKRALRQFSSKINISANGPIHTPYRFDAKANFITIRSIGWAVLFATRSHACKSCERWGTSQRSMFYIEETRGTCEYVWLLIM
jgi:hypothetical protein